ncbi:PA-phosphatase like phosphoesterase [Caballeronia arationis]|jgi:membrane-associated phospholipid phosphatase|uniref:PAP2 superfamily protein n=1 Tax=Caballeronia arationis TaxID=1777142 RepID=A0A7Z7N485_9BURK|nr:phosphatase PAP2 family protein [Caballeronia arationis]SAK99510.1 PA-phosphatase like phosphoesterase [Caballeronia arationis]SOE80847.1 PAP2 superfamily protein [Caballeronia arationis]
MFHTTWISNLGDAGLLLPLALACAIWLRVTGKHLALRWLVYLAAGMALVGASKILYAGCGIQIEAVQFRVISGHTMLAAAVWPVSFALLAAGARPAWHRAGALCGLALAAVIGMCRIVEDAHTPAEVVAGWLLGGFIAMLVLERVFSEPRRIPRVLVAGLGLLAVSSIAYGHRAPFQAMILHYSPWICQGLGPS